MFLRPPGDHFYAMWMKRNSSLVSRIILSRPLASHFFRIFCVKWLWLSSPHDTAMIISREMKLITPRLSRKLSAIRKGFQFQLRDTRNVSKKLLNLPLVSSHILPRSGKSFSLRSRMLENKSWKEAALAENVFIVPEEFDLFFILVYRSRCLILFIVCQCRCRIETFFFSYPRRNWRTFQMLSSADSI